MRYCTVLRAQPALTLHSCSGSGRGGDSHSEVHCGICPKVGTPFPLLGLAADPDSSLRPRNWFSCRRSRGCSALSPARGVRKGVSSSLSSRTCGRADPSAERNAVVTEALAPPERANRFENARSRRRVTCHVHLKKFQSWISE